MIQEGGKIISEKAKRLLSVVKETAISTTYMVENSKSVLKYPSNIEVKNELR